jgi:hypothetical protein
MFVIGANLLGLSCDAVTAKKVMPDLACVCRSEPLQQPRCCMRKKRVLGARWCTLW